MTDEWGKFPAELRISSGGEVLGTANFMFIGERNPHPEGTTDGQQGTIIPELTLLVNEIRESNARVAEMTASAHTSDVPTAEYDAETNNLEFGIPSIPEEEFLKAFVTDSASGSIASITDGADGLPVKSLNVNIVPKQSGSGDPSPSNVRPISGYTDVNVYDDSAYGGIIEWNQLWNMGNGTSTGEGVTCVRNGSKISYSGTFTGGSYADGTSGGSAFHDQFVVGHRYLITISSTDNRLYIVVNNPYIGTDGATVANNLKSVFYTPTAKPTYFFLRIKASNGEAVNGNGTVNVFDLTRIFGESKAEEIYAMGRANGTAYFKSLFPKDYYPYNAGEETVVGAVNGDPYRHYPISLGQTVYGGTLEVMSGKLTLTWASRLVNSMSWTYVAPSSSWTKGLFYTSDINSVKKAGIENIKCERYKTLRNNTDDYLIFGNAPNGYVYIVDSTYSSASAMVSAIGTMPIIYELATPTEITLTPTEVTTLLGNNNIWANSGDVEVEYRADTKKYVDKKIAETQAMILENIGG